MLDFIRRGVKSIFAKILLGLLVASFADWGIGDAFSGFSLTSPVASVGERDVTVDTYSTSLQRLQSQRSQERRTVVSLSDLRRSGEAEGLLQRLIRDAALGAELDALGVTAPDAAVAEAITNLPAFQGPDGEFSAPAYRQLLANQGLSTAEFEALQRDEIGRAVVAQAVAGSVIAPPGVVARIAAYEGARREVAVMTLTPDMAEVPAAPDDATLAAHLEANPDRFREPERKHGRLLHIDIRALAAGIDVDADAARAEYEASRSQFVTEGTAEIDQLPFPDLAAAEAAAAAIAGGKPFEEAVADRGLDPAAVDLGSVTAADLPAPVAEAVFALDAPGIAAPVETLLGAALIRVRSITPTITIPFEAVAEQMALRAAERVASARIAELAGTVEDLRAEGRTLEEIAEAVDAAVIRAIPGRAADNTVEGGAPAEGVIARNDMAAELDEAIDGEERDLVRLGNGGYVLVVIDRIEPAFVPDLDAIRDRVAEDWALEQRLA
ncbi:MAG: SurA N-terminal domain-containing protein, partial [Pseudomonadota bacterium]